MSTLVLDSLENSKQLCLDNLQCWLVQMCKSLIAHLALGNFPEDGIVEQRDPRYFHELLVAELCVDGAQLGGGGEEEHLGQGRDHSAQLLGCVLGVVDKGRGPERGEAGGRFNKPHGESKGCSRQLGGCNVGQ